LLDVMHAMKAIPRSTSSLRRVVIIKFLQINFTRRDAEFAEQRLSIFFSLCSPRLTGEINCAKLFLSDFFSPL